MYATEIPKETDPAGFLSFSSSPYCCQPVVPLLASCHRQSLQQIPSRRSAFAGLAVLVVYRGDKGVEEGFKGGGGGESVQGTRSRTRTYKTYVENCWDVISHGSQQRRYNIQVYVCILVSVYRWYTRVLRERCTGLCVYLVMRAGS